jgi:hypothetical protein
MPRDFFDPTPEQQNVVLVSATLQEAECLIESVSTAILKALRFPSVTSSIVSPDHPA